MVRLNPLFRATGVTPERELDHVGFQAEGRYLTSNHSSTALANGLLSAHSNSVKLMSDTAIVCGQLQAVLGRAHSLRGCSAHVPPIPLVCQSLPYERKSCEHCPKLFSDIQRKHHTHKEILHRDGAQWDAFLCRRCGTRTRNNARRQLSPLLPSSFPLQDRSKPALFILLLNRRLLPNAACYLCLGFPFDVFSAPCRCQASTWLAHSRTRVKWVVVGGQMS